jgi:hypothetical protein
MEEENKEKKVTRHSSTRQCHVSCHAAWQPPSTAHTSKISGVFPQLRDEVTGSAIF